MKNTIRDVARLRDAEGATLVEYILIVALILVVIISLQPMFLSSISNSYKNNNQTFNTIGVTPLVANPNPT